MTDPLGVIPAEVTVSAADVAEVVERLTDDDIPF